MKEDPEVYCRFKGALKKSRSIGFFREFKRVYEKLELTSWQISLCEKLDGEADSRKIFWCYGSRGGEGKTTFGKYLVATRGAMLINGGRNEDIIFAYDYQKIVIFDVARCQDVRYDLIEHFKDGVLFNQKYESHVMYLLPPHVVIMSNVPPDYTKISEDRVLERCPKTDRLHLQGMFELHKPQRPSWVKKNLLGNTVHLEKCIDRDKAREYCRKEETRVAGPWEHGVWLTNEVASSNLARSMKDAEDGKPIDEIMKEDPEVYCRFKGALKKSRSIGFFREF
ncbi:hypothetical protein SLEP1_g60483, partial [Rubroshorea leprosula]